ncbi:manganese efflux pump [Alteromonas sediminis]|uniref:Putative manganese efflux pump MntP n=1 Tax=Alteromonas sediminis TaxID=2259342 RepID=A0A3N5YAC4_9ALTE|nr:manganese efflux pump MntP family protein [Alteromonas sediminis]RPJ68469.1 manganese efflux pump [Alteromonas sediminis]
MSLITLVFLAFAMSTDAFAAAISKGVKLKTPELSYALKTGLIFGSVEAITPVVGWLLGRAAATYIEAWDHWVALIILVGLGTHMIYDSMKDDDEEAKTSNSKPSLLILMLTALGTSIDAMAVGVSLAFIDVNIVLAASLIGLATFSMVTIGVMLGSVLGSFIGKRAETLGGLVLVALGLWIGLGDSLGVS